MEKLAEQWIDKQLDRYATNGFGHLAVELKSTGKLIAMGGILPRNLDGKSEFEIGYSVNPRQWGNGYATEIALNSGCLGSLKKIMKQIFNEYFRKAPLIICRSYNNK